MAMLQKLGAAKKIRSCNLTKTQFNVKVTSIEFDLKIFVRMVQKNIKKLLPSSRGEVSIGRAHRSLHLFLAAISHPNILVLSVSSSHVKLQGSILILAETRLNGTFCLRFY